MVMPIVTLVKAPVPSLLVIDNVPLKAGARQRRRLVDLQLDRRAGRLPGDVALNLRECADDFSVGVTVSIGLALLFGGHGRVERGLDRAQIEEVSALALPAPGTPEDALAPVLHGQVPAIEELHRLAGRYRAGQRRGEKLGHFVRGDRSAAVARGLGVGEERRHPLLERRRLIGVEPVGIAAEQRILGVGDRRAWRRPAAKSVMSAVMPRLAPSPAAVVRMPATSASTWSNVAMVDTI